MNKASGQIFQSVENSSAWCLVNEALEARIKVERRSLKEQYPVTVHVQNFDLLTGCREFKRCEESKRTLKKPFASLLAEFDPTRAK